MIIFDDDSTGEPTSNNSFILSKSPVFPPIPKKYWSLLFTKHFIITILFGLVTILFHFMSLPHHVIMSFLILFVAFSILHCFTDWMEKLEAQEE